MSRQSVAGYKEDYLEPRMLLRHLEVLWGVIVKLVRASIKDTQFRSEKIEMKLVDKGGDVENVNGGNQPACLRIVASHQSLKTFVGWAAHTSYLQTFGNIWHPWNRKVFLP